MIFSEIYDTVALDNGRFEIIYYDSVGEEISYLGFDKSNTLRYCKAAMTYYYSNHSSLKQVGWDRNGTLQFYVIIDSTGNEFYWDRSENGENTIIQFDIEMEGIGLTFYNTGELMTRSSIHGDSVFHQDFYQTGKTKRMYYTHYYGGAYFGSYQEFDTTGVLILSGQYYSLPQLIIFDMKLLAQNKSVTNGVKHGIWTSYTSKGKIYLVETYKDGVLISSDQKRKPVKYN